MNNLPKKSTESRSVMEQLMHPLIGLSHEMNRAMYDFYDLFEKSSKTLEQFQNMRLSPAMDLVEEKDGYTVQMEMPGLDEKDIKVSVHNNILSIHGAKSVSKKNENKKYVSREISYGEYLRNISLPENADLDKINATFKKSMLWITIPKKAITGRKNKEIKVKAMD